MEEEEMHKSMERAFQDCGRTLETVTSFKYLGQVLTAADDNWMEVVGNLRKEQKSWAQLARILGQKDTSPRVLGVFSRR